MADAKTVDDGIRTLGHQAFCSNDVFRVDFVLTGQNIQHQKLAVMFAFDIRTNVLLVDRFAALDDFFTGVFGIGHAGIPEIEIEFANRIVYSSIDRPSNYQTIQFASISGISPMTDSTLPPEIRSLPVAQRIDLVEQIWDSIVEDEHAFELTDSQKAELDRRIASHKESPGRGTPWEDVKKQLLGE